MYLWITYDSLDIYRGITVYEKHITSQTLPWELQITKEDLALLNSNNFNEKESDSRR